MFGVIGTLNAVSAPIDYLRMIGNVAGLQLQEGALLTASAQNLLPFHMGLAQALLNISTLRQLQTTIPILLPEQYLLHPKKVGVKAQVEKVTVIETVEPIKDRYIRDQLKDMESKLRSEMRELGGRKQKTELATVVEMLSEMRGDRSEKEHNYKRKRENSREKDDYRREERNGAKKWQGEESRKRCYKCGQTGHMKSECKDREKCCIFCKATDHDVDRCQKRREAVCRQCNRKGHSAGFHKVHLCRKCGKEHSGVEGC